MKKGRLCPLFLLLLLVITGCSKALPKQPAAVPTIIPPTSAATPAPVSAPVFSPALPPQDGLGEDGLLHVYLLGQGEQVETPESSFIRYLVYYPESQHLIINMNGKDYVFANVEEALWQGFKEAEVKGKYYNAIFKGKPAYHVKDYDGTNGNLIVIHTIE